MNFSTIIAGDILDMEYSPTMNNFRVTQNKANQEIDCVPLSANSFSLILNGRTYHLTITPQLDGYEVTVNNYTHFVQVKDKLEILLEKLGIHGDAPSHTGEIFAPIPGIVSRIFVKSGDSVKTGKNLCILEAMKMENEIISPINGTITSIHIDSGDNVEKGNLLMEIST